VVLNSLAGEFIPASLKTLRPYGRFLEIGKRDIYADAKLGLFPFRNNLSYFAIDLGKMIADRHPAIPRMFMKIMEQFARSQLVPPPTGWLPIGKVVEGFKRMSRAEHIGKIVFQVRDDVEPWRGINREFRGNYGRGVSVRCGREIFRKILSSPHTCDRVPVGLKATCHFEGHDSA